MKRILEKSHSLRAFLAKHCKHLNTGKSPVFILISLIVGIFLTAISALFAIKTTIGQVCFVVGLVTAVINAAQLIYKKYI